MLGMSEAIIPIKRTKKFSTKNGNVQMDFAPAFANFNHFICKRCNYRGKVSSFCGDVGGFVDIVVSK